MEDVDLKAQQIYAALQRGFSPDDLERAYVLGLLPKDRLEDGVLYHGHCRNASIARWNAGRQRFVYRRTKFGSSFDEEIPHPIDDDGFDIFAVSGPVAQYPQGATEAD